MISRQHLIRAAGLFSGAGLFVGSAQAQSAGPITTADIVRRGRARIGVLTGAPPFGMADPQGNPSGYDVDVANIVARYLGVPADLTALTPPARIPALEAGRVDFLIATLAPTPERAKAVMFTMPYSAFRTAIFARKSLQLGSLADLAGKTVGVNRGSSQDAALVRLAPRGTRITRFEDDSTTAQALFAGQIDSIAMPDTIARAISQTRPEADIENKFHFFNQGNSMTVRKDQFELRQWLNNTIYFMKVSGELDELFRKWAEAPLPELPVF